MENIYIVEYENVEYLGKYQGEDRWRLFPVNENLTEQTGDSFVLENELIEIKNKAPRFIEI